MLARSRALFRLITRTGSATKVVGQLNAYVRFCVLDALRPSGLFSYLEDPHTLDEICDQMGYPHDAFTDLVFEVLANEKDGVLLLEDGLQAVGQRLCRTDDPAQ